MKGWNGMKYFEQAYEHMERPFAWLDLDALDANINFINQTATMPIRIATKSIRSLPVLHYIMERLDTCVGVMTFSASETLYVLQHCDVHCLIGYPVMERTQIRQLLQYDNVTFMVDHVAQIMPLREEARKANKVAHVCIDLNMSTDFKALYFGTKRSSLHNIATLNHFLPYLQHPHIMVDGVMGYEAQIAGVSTHPINRVKGWMIRSLQRRAKKEVANQRRLLVAHCKFYFPHIRFVNGGGTGSIHYTTKQKEVTEMTIGSAFYAPSLFDDFNALSLQPAAGFALRVTRHPEPNTVVAHGGGYIASGAIAQEKAPVFVTHGYHLLSLEGAGEVQTPVHIDKHAQPLQIGDTVYMRHAKAGELCERFNTLHAVRGREYRGEMSTYRGDGQCFL